MQDLIDALRGYVRSMPAANIINSDVTVEGLVNELRKIPKFDSSREVNDPILQNAMSGVTFWHGSPHKWKKPDPQYFRSGEGVMTEGEGLYTSSDRGVGKWYAQTLARNRSLLAEELRGPGYLYQLNYPNSEFAKFLRPDNPLSNQHPVVQKALRELDEEFVRNSTPTGPLSREEFLGGPEFNKRATLESRTLWPWIMKAESRLPPTEEIFADEAQVMLSRELAKKGVRGLEFLDNSNSSDFAELYNKPVSVIYPDTLDMVNVLRRMVVK